MTIKRTLTVALASMVLTAATAQEYFQRIAMEGVDIIGSITYGKVDQYTTMSQGYYAFPYDSKFAPTKTSPVKGAQVAGGCCYHDGIIYSNEFDDAAQVHKQQPRWRRYDAKTWELLDEHTLSDNCTSTTSSLAYDVTNDMIYGINYTYDESYIVSIMPETGEMERLGMLSRDYKYFALGCNNAGTLYIIYMDPLTDAWYLGKVRKSDGKVAKIRNITVTNLLEGDSYINSANKQALFYNAATDKFYWMFGSSSMYLYAEYTAIMELDPVAATASQVAYLDDSFLISGAFFVEPSLDAPAIAENFKFTPEAEGSLKGTLSFTAPTTTYNGQSLTDNVTVTVAEGSDTLLTQTVTPGAQVVSDAMTFSNAMHHVTITASNDAGDGPTIKRSFYVGYDLPTACTNITLTNEGLTTHLTWDAPTTGQNGQAINAANLTYDVVRYPYEVTVAEGITERSFTEEHPGDMTRYVYLVTPRDGNRRGTGKYSNNLIVGTPLNVPYGGAFTGPADMLNYYTIRDANNDLFQWKYDASTNRALYEFNYNNTSVAADDWLIAPFVNYEAGKEYTLQFTTYSSMPNYPEAMAVTFGDKPTIVAQTQTLLDLPSIPGVDDNGVGNTYAVDFTVPTDGVYHYAFHAYSPAFHANLYLYDISVFEKGTNAILSATNGRAGVAVREGGLLLTNVGGSTVKVYDVNGRQVFQTSEPTAEVSLPSGLYLVNLDGKTVKTIVK